MVCSVCSACADVNSSCKLWILVCHCSRSTQQRFLKHPQQCFRPASQSGAHVHGTRRLPAYPAAPSHMARMLDEAPVLHLDMVCGRRSNASLPLSIALPLTPARSIGRSLQAQHLEGERSDLQAVVASQKKD